jgi:hypothetical protein
MPNRDLFQDKYTAKTNGGFVVYYVSPGKGKVTAFKPVSVVRNCDLCLSTDEFSIRASACSLVTRLRERVGI